MRVYNFRDLGGAITSCQKTVKSGLVYRTSNVTHFEEREARHFVEDHGIRLYIDFRGVEEVKSIGRPDALLGKNVEWLHLPINPEDPDFGQLHRPKAKDWVALYKGIFERNLDLWKKFMTTIADYDQPLTYGCLFGKDRTGIATSLILHTLDVPEEHIVADYHRTTQEVRPVYEQFKYFWEEFPLTEDEIFEHFLTAPKDVIRDFLDYVKTHPEETPAGMLMQELSTATKEKLKTRLLK